jgi:hypothetical protein
LSCSPVSLTLAQGGEPGEGQGEFQARGSKPKAMPPRQRTQTGVGGIHLCSDCGHLAFAELMRAQVWSSEERTRLWTWRWGWRREVSDSAEAVGRECDMSKDEDLETIPGVTEHWGERRESVCLCGH